MLTAVIVAAGSSRRMGFDKLFADLAGRPVVAHCVAAFQQCEAVTEIVVVTRPDCAEALRELGEAKGWGKLKALVEGGPERHLSVWNGLQAATGEFVAVHDGARPLITPAMIERCFQKARETGAACCAAPVSDTLKHAGADQVIDGSVDRAGLWGMQTPQMFETEALRAAYRAVLSHGHLVTDEASAYPGPVSLVDPADHNLKITYPRDLELAAAILKQRGL